MDFSEKLAISQLIQKRNYAFRVFWDMSDVIWDEEIPAAAVAWNLETYEPTLRLNEKFWRQLDDDSKVFLIMHECLHVLFNHVLRFAEHRDMPDDKIYKHATDIVINEMLTSKFGFDRDSLSPFLWDKDNPENPNNGLWIDNVFGPYADQIKHDKDTEYYAQKLKELFGDPNAGEQYGKSGLQGFDAHDISSIADAEDLIESLEQSGFMEAVDQGTKDKLSESEESKELEKKGTMAGDGTGNWLSVQVSQVKRKQKWETVVRNFSRKLLKTEAKLDERWDRVKPLYSPIMSRHPDIKLPSESWVIGPSEEEKKGLIYMFLDCSGSCIHLKDRFFKAAMTVDPRRIDLRLFSFDTSTHELDIKVKRVNGGGGTRFDIIEDRIQNIMSKEKKKYPDQVFVLTDGDGTPVDPEKPDRWIWFLESKNDTKRYIPQKSKVFYLSDFE